ncbi:MAG: hypothetical protein ABIP03_06010 [Aquihabitans sp.]
MKYLIEADFADFGDEETEFIEETGGPLDQAVHQLSQEIACDASWRRVADDAAKAES